MRGQIWYLDYNSKSLCITPARRVWELVALGEKLSLRTGNMVVEREGKKVYRPSAEVFWQNAGEYCEDILDGISCLFPEGKREELDEVLADKKGARWLAVLELFHAYVTALPFFLLTSVPPSPNISVQLSKDKCWVSYNQIPILVRMMNFEFVPLLYWKELGSWLDEKAKQEMWLLCTRLAVTDLKS